METTRFALFEALQELIRKVIANPQLQITENSRLMTDLGLDSVDVVEVVTDLEEKCQKSIDVSAIVVRRKLQREVRFFDLTVGDLVTACMDQSPDAR